jgi:hypothetical protein
MQFGMLVERHGDADVAERLLVRAIEVVGDAFPIVSAHASYALGLIDERRAPGSGRERMLEAGAHFRRVGDLGCLNGVNRALADVSRHDGDDDGALDRLRQTVWMMPGVDDHELAASLVQIAEIYLDRGQLASAGALAGVAHRLRSGRGIGWNARQRARFYAVRAGAARSEEPLSVEAAIAVACDG